MNHYEQAVRPSLERMIQDRRTFLSASVQTTLAQYLTHKLLVLDWLGEQPALPENWAHEFYRTRAIHEGVFMWMFHCLEGKWRSDIETEGVGLADVENWHPDLTINTKSFAVGFGDLFIFSIFTTEIDLELEFEPAVTARLWPPSADLIIWPPRYPIDSEQAEYIRHSVGRIWGRKDKAENFGTLVYWQRPEPRQFGT